MHHRARSSVNTKQLVQRKVSPFVWAALPADVGRGAVGEGRARGCSSKAAERAGVVATASVELVISTCILHQLQVSSFILLFTLTFSRCDTTTMPKDSGRSTDRYVLSLQL